MRRPPLFAVLPALVGLASCALTASRFDSPAAQGLRLAIRATRADVPEGQTPEIRAVIMNEGPGAAHLVKPGDGSEAGWRTPLVGWSVIRLARAHQQHPKGMPVLEDRTPVPIAPPRPDEVVALAPGDRLDLGMPLDLPTLRAGGVYRVRLYYTNDPDLAWGGHAAEEPSQDAMAHVRQSTPCRLVSNELLVRVRRKGQFLF